MVDESQNDKKELADDGSEWTSYSDLFTSVSIIFLMMFIFSFLTAGINTLKNVEERNKQKKILEAQLDKKDIEKEKKRVDTIEKSVAELDKMSKDLRKRVEDINNLSNRVKDYKKIVKKVIKDKQDKDKIINNISKVIKDKNKVIKDLKNKVLKAQTTSLLSEKNYKKRKTRIQKLENQIKDKEKVIKSLRDSKENLKKKLVTSDDQLLKLHKSNLAKRTGIDKNYQKIQKDYKNLNSKLKKQLQANLELEQNVGKLKSQNTVKSDEISALVGERNRLKVENDKLQKKFASLMKSIEKKIEREPASVQKDTLRAYIGRKLKERFEKENIDIETDPYTGLITISMDEAFLFANNSYELSATVKEKLKKLIPVYVEVLFSNAKIKKEIKEIFVVGHASPTYKKVFADPSIIDYEAYNYNLILSSNRANQIIQYIFSKDFGDFKHFLEFRKKISAIGKSYSKPIMKSSVNQNKKDDRKICGKYHCRLSRRVEIRFNLRETKHMKKNEKIQKLSSNQLKGL